ncbi:MAG: P27 family phage terminase small subunit [Desulfobulbaceae bacterium]|nr:P27 family phage terminase small subunit [Desulfobulbaceae bacterium]
MAAHRKPTAVMEKSGAFKKNPNRRRVDPETVGPIGECPTYFDEAERTVWAEIVSTAPQNVLTAADNLIVETLARSIAQMRATPAGDIKPAMLAQIRQGLSSLGMSPADRSRVQPAWTAVKDNPFSRI